MSVRYTAVLLLAVLLALPVSAQSVARERAIAYVQNNAARHGLSTADVAGLVVTDETVSSRSGVTHVYVRQSVDGVPVVSGAMTLNVARDGRVLLASGALVPGLALRAARGSAVLSPAQAATALALDAGLVPAEPFATTTPAFAAGDRAELTTGGGLTRVPVRAGLVYADDGTGALRLAYETTLYLRSGGADWYGLVDAASGRIIERTDVLARDAFGPAAGGDVAPVSLAPVAPSPAIPLALQPLVIGGASYRVFASPNESPIHNTVLPPADGRVLVTSIESPTASPFGWHDTDGVAGAEFTTARGNNVRAYADRNDSNDAQPSEEVDGGAGLVFDFPIDFSQAPVTYQNAAVTNLFYWNNVFHDLLAGFGFDAASGNFQQNLYGAATGIGNDAVQAEAQDGAVTCNSSNPCSNNANFSTPADGQPGRMQMYEWTNSTPRRDGDLDAGIILHEYTHGVSTRLTGGPSQTGCLRNSEQMGEGWGDWYGLMLTMKPGDVRATGRGIGTYALNQPVSGLGIRPARYSTDFALNDYTYQRTRSGLAVPHGIGFVWATILWEASWEMIDAYGFSPDLANAGGTAGNQMMLNLVTEAMKMQPCSPGFVDGRNAILAADQALYNGDHLTVLWRAFARRGLGATASQGLSSSNSDNTESFIEPEAIAPSPVTDLAAVPNGDYVTLTFTATGDDAGVGTATTYALRRSATPITTDAEFDAATVVPTTVAPRVAGTPETLVAAGLAFQTRYYFALKVSDESLNTSTLSNTATAVTLGAPTATVPSAPIAVTTSTTATATVAIANNGPSDLRFSVDLAEAAPRPVPPDEAGTTGDVPAEGPKGEAGTAGQAQRMGAGGPDAFGYRWADSNAPGGPTYNWVDISTTGTAVTLADDATTTVPLPFPFSFYGIDQTSVRIVSNGWLGFGGTSTAYSNSAIPSAAQPNNALYAFWDDLNPTAGGSIRYQDMGDGRFVVSYIGVQRYNDAASTLTFQIILTRGGQILYQYKTMPGTLTSATVGIENATGTVGLQAVSNAAYIQNNLAVRFAALFVDADVTAGLIPAGGSRAVTLTFDASGLAAGTYRATMTVRTNGTNAPVTVIPLTLTVGAVGGESGPLAFEGTHLLGAVYPNPATGASRVDLAVAEAQTVRVELYDALGRRVAVAFEGPMAPRTSVAVPVGAGSLAAGTYVLRVTGETFQDARRITVVR